MGNVFFGGGKVGMIEPGYFDVNTVLLMHCDALKDHSQFKSTLTNTGAEFTTDAKFGKYALNSFAASKGIKVAHNNAFNFGNGNFTIEFWVKFSSVTAGYQTLIDHRGTADGTGWLILVEQGNYIAFLASAGSNWTVNLNLGSIADYQDKWVHVAVVRNGNTFTGYINGVAKGSTSNSLTINSVTTDMFIGVGSSNITAGLTSAHYLQGSIDEIRISNAARWTGAFTPPTAAYKG